DNNDATGAAPVVVIRDDGTALDTTTPLGANKLQTAFAVQVGSDIYTGLAILDQPATDVHLLKNNTAVAGANCKGNANGGPVVDGTGTLYCADETNAKNIRAILPDGTVTAASIFIATNPLTNLFATSNGVVAFDGTNVYTATVTAGAVAMGNASGAVVPAGNICSNAAAKVRNQGTNNVSCTLGTTSTPTSGNNLAVLVDANTAVVLDVDGTANKSGVALDGPGLQIASATFALYGVPATQQLFACRINGANTSCTQLSRVAYNDVVNQADIFVRRQSLTTRVYNIGNPRVIDMANDTVKTYPIGLFAGITSGPDAGYIKHDLGMVATPTQIPGTSCASRGAGSAVAVGALGASTGTTVNTSIFNPTAPTVCIDRILGVY
ncbi:MAG: hypothetical protein QW175_08020, partial [Candidatus Bathyarchaeia archaeon]